MIATTSHSFLSCNPQQENIFSVRPGIAAVDALQMASSFLDVARTAAYEVESADCNLSTGAAYLITMAKALVDSVTMDGTTRPDEFLLATVFERLWSLHLNGVLVVAECVSKIEADDANGFIDWVGQQVKGGAK